MMKTMKRIGPWGLGLSVALVLFVGFGGFLSAKEEAEKPTAFMGVSVNMLHRSEKEELGIKWGVRVVAVERKSAADAAGIEIDDILLTFGGEKIRQAFDLTQMVGEHNPGDSVDLGLLRDKKPLSLKIKLGERKSKGELYLNPPEGDEPPPLLRHFRSQGEKRAYLGITLDQVEGEFAEYFGLEKQGVVVRSLEADGPAAKAGLKAGDVLVTLGDQKIVETADVHKALGKLKAGDKAELSILRHGKGQKVKVILGEREGHPFLHFFKGDGRKMLLPEKGMRHFFFESEDLPRGEGHEGEMRWHSEDPSERIRVLRRKAEPLTGHFII